jgi:hypothetical protein
MSDAWGDHAAFLWIVFGFRASTVAGHGYVVSGLALPRATCAQVLQRVAADGAFVLFRDHLSAAEHALWRAELERLARSAGIRLAIRDMGGVVLISDSTHRRQVAQIARTLNPPAVDPDEDDDQEDDDEDHVGQATDLTRDHRSRGAHLHLVRDDD